MVQDSVVIKYKLGLSFYRNFTGKSVKVFYRFTGKMVAVNFGKCQPYKRIEMEIFSTKKNIFSFHLEICRFVPQTIQTCKLEANS